LLSSSKRDVRNCRIPEVPLPSGYSLSLAGKRPYLSGRSHVFLKGAPN
jgi:hypothetical protein